MPETFLTSDEHYFHDNVVPYSGRPFKNIGHMNETLIANHNAVVGVNDFTWHLGDFDMHASSSALDSILPRLNGEHGLVQGNHEKCWVGHMTGYKHIGRYLDAGFSYVVPFAQVKIPHHEEGTPGHRAMMSHFPYTGDHGDRPDRYPEFRLPDTGRWLLHGHVHDVWAQRGRQINVGVDARGYAPISLTEIATIVALGPRDVETSVR
jgi:calcineurin-like phosphoesterase family protein